LLASRKSQPQVGQDLTLRIASDTVAPLVQHGHLWRRCEGAPLLPAIEGWR
jgi:hypothetical protein